MNYRKILNLFHTASDCKGETKALKCTEKRKNHSSRCPPQLRIPFNNLFSCVAVHEVTFLFTQTISKQFFSELNFHHLVWHPAACLEDSLEHA